MTITTYEQALDFWTERTNYESIGMPTDPLEFTLDRMRALLHELGNPEKQLKIIHIAGTKGKGSTAAMLAAIMQQAGYRTGLFTSPHLTDVEERVQVNGQPISPTDFIQCISKMEHAVRRVESEHHSALTYFEIITALGFLHFAQSEVDVAVVEVGLGGRLDSTNDVSRQWLQRFDLAPPKHSDSSPSHCHPPLSWHNAKHHRFQSARVFLPRIDHGLLQTASQKSRRADAGDCVHTHGGVGARTNCVRLFDGQD